MWRFQYGCIFLTFGKERKIKISYSLICQKGKIYKYPWDVFFMLWTLLGLGHDTWAYELRLLSIHFLHSFFFWASLANIPTGLAHFCTSLPLLGFIRPHSQCASPFHSLGFLGPFHSSSFLNPFSSFLPLLLLQVFAKSFGLPRPNYHIFTFYYLFGLLAFVPTL